MEPRPPPPRMPPLRIGPSRDVTPGIVRVVSRRLVVANPLIKISVDARYSGNLRRATYLIVDTSGATVGPRTGTAETAPVATARTSVTIYVHTV